MINEYPAPKNPTTANIVEVNIAKRFPQLSLPQHPQQSLFFRPKNTSAGKIIKTPLPNIPPKSQTSSERWSLLSITFPPGKNSRMLARKPNTVRGMRVPPGTWHSSQCTCWRWRYKVCDTKSFAAFFTGSLQIIGHSVLIIVHKSIRILELRNEISP